MPVTVKTNNQWRDLIYRQDVPAKILAEQFDYLGEDDSPDGFFRYRGHWYHVSDFMAFTGNVEPTLKGWHGYSGDSYFSGVLIRLSRDGERIKTGMYFS